MTWEDARDLIVWVLHKYDIEEEPTEEDVKRLVDASWRKYQREAEEV